LLTGEWYTNMAMKKLNKNLASFGLCYFLSR
jgi:hypothetical protein